MKQLPLEIAEAIEEYADKYSSARIERALYENYGEDREVELAYEYLVEAILAKIS